MPNLFINFDIFKIAMKINADIKSIDILLANNADLYTTNDNGSTAFHEGKI